MVQINFEISTIWMIKGMLLLLFSECGVHLSEGYKPVIIVHGLFDGPPQFETFTSFITKAHAGTNVFVIGLNNYVQSLKPMWAQVNGFTNAIHPIMLKAPDGVHLICFSQGGLICRGLLSTMSDHNVNSFIALSSPLAGQYGDTTYLKWIFPNHLKKNIFHVCYSLTGQKLSICNYWNDPHHADLFLQRSVFLPVLNGDKPHKQLEVWKDNFVRIRKLVLIGGPDDGVITPWQSSHFGFYDDNETIVELKQQQWYVKDTFGLKTLDARGDLEMCVVSGVSHTQWHSNQTVFTNCIEKWLT